MENNFLSELRITLCKGWNTFVKDLLVPLIVTATVEHYTNAWIAAIALVLSSSLWSAWLTLLDAPGSSLKWKLAWYKDGPTPDEIQETAARTARISFTIVAAILVHKWIYG